jgi:nickel superoxide dismutase
MKNKLFLFALKGAFISAFTLALSVHQAGYGHCQMPCGIYHDDMVFSQIDQYIETTVKGIAVMKSNKFDSVEEHNEFVRWVIQKENSSNTVAELITKYFLQQKIKVGEEDTTKQLVSVHKLLFFLVQIKQHADIKIVKQFYDEWERFKLMFHIEGYACQLEKVKDKMWEEKKELLKGEQGTDTQDPHDRPHEHSH